MGVQEDANLHGGGDEDEDVHRPRAARNRREKTRLA